MFKIDSQRFQNAIHVHQKKFEHLVYCQNLVYIWYNIFFSYLSHLIKRTGTFKIYQFPYYKENNKYKLLLHYLAHIYQMINEQFKIVF